MDERQLQIIRRDLEQQPWLYTLMAQVRAAGNDTRISILYLLWQYKEMRVNDFAAIMGVSTPAISQQLKKLRRHALVESRRDAQNIYYRLNPASAFLTCLTNFFEEGGGAPLDD